jgi:hypothetical protein
LIASKKCSGRHAARLRRDGITARLSCSFNFLATRPPYDARELLTDSEADTNKSDERLTEIHTFKSSAEMNRAIRQQAATQKLEKSSWIRQAIGKQLSDAKGRKEIYPGASAALKELAERFADIQRCADELESGDLSLFLRSFRALLICLLDGNDVRQTHEDQRAFWHKIGAEVSRLRRDQSLGAALPIMLSSIVSDLNTVGRNLRAQGL